MSISGGFRYLRRPLDANVRSGDRVLVLSDTAHDPRVWQVVLALLEDIGADATLALFPARPADYYDPPSTVCQAMQLVDVNILLCSTGMLHCDASRSAMAKGIPSICMDGGMTLEMFQSGAVTADYRKIRVYEHYVAHNIYGEAKNVRVTSALGTDLTYDVEGRIFAPSLPSDGFDPYKAVRFIENDVEGESLYSFVFPGGEFTVAPVEGSANGTCVIDLTMHHLDRLSSPISLTIEDGRIASMDGGADARTLRDFLATYGDENALLFPAEASIGINPEARIIGNQREDKCVFGTMHFGLGTNIDVGGTIHSKIHMDGVMLSPTLYTNGELKIEDGNVLVPLDRPLTSRDEGYLERSSTASV